MAEVITGGCQCGAVRYRVETELGNPHLCHCRMCQKAAGNYFMPLAGAAREAVVVTRGEPGWFHSSDIVRRGFCRDCGTPLFFDPLDSEHMLVTLGSLDDPAAVRPVSVYGTEARMPWIAEVCAMKGVETRIAPPSIEIKMVARIPSFMSVPPRLSAGRWRSARKASRW